MEAVCTDNRLSGQVEASLKTLARAFGRALSPSLSPAPRETLWDGGGFSLDAEVRIEGDDRAGPERLLRYCTPPRLCAGAAAADRWCIRCRPCPGSAL